MPRILVGVAPYFVWLLIRRIVKGENRAGKVIVDLIASVILFASVRAFLMRLLP